MTIHLPDDDEMIKVWAWVFAIGFVMNYILTRYSYCHMNIPLCQPPVPKKMGTGIAYTMGPTTDVKGKSPYQLVVPVKCENIPITQLDKPTTTTTELGSTLTISALVFLLIGFLQSRRSKTAYEIGINEGLFIGLGVIGIINWSGALGGGAAGGPLTVIAALVVLALVGNLLNVFANQTTEPIFHHLAIGAMITLALVFLFNIKNIYAGFIGSAIGNISTLTLVLAQVVALADIIRMLVKSDEDMITLYSSVLGIALLIQLAIYLYNIYKCYRISYTCVPDLSYKKDKGQFQATIGCHAKF